MPNIIENVIKGEKIETPITFKQDQDWLEINFDADTTVKSGVNDTITFNLENVKINNNTSFKLDGKEYIIHPYNNKSQVMLNTRSKELYIPIASTIDNNAEFYLYRNLEASDKNLYILDVTGSKPYGPIEFSNGEFKFLDDTNKNDFAINLRKYAVYDQEPEKVNSSTNEGKIVEDVINTTTESTLNETIQYAEYEDLKKRFFNSEASEASEAIATSFIIRTHSQQPICFKPNNSKFNIKFDDDDYMSIHQYSDETPSYITLAIEDINGNTEFMINGKKYYLDKTRSTFIFNDSSIGIPIKNKNDDIEYVFYLDKDNEAILFDNKFANGQCVTKFDSINLPNSDKAFKEAPSVVRKSLVISKPDTSSVVEYITDDTDLPSSFHIPNEFEKSEELSNMSDGYCYKAKDPNDAIKIHNFELQLFDDLSNAKPIKIVEVSSDSDSDSDCDTVIVVDLDRLLEKSSSLASSVHNYMKFGGLKVFNRQNTLYEMVYNSKKQCLSFYPDGDVISTVKYAYDIPKIGYITDIKPPIKLTKISFDPENNQLKQLDFKVTDDDFTIDNIKYPQNFKVTIEYKYDNRGKEFISSVTAIPSGSNKAIKFGNIDINVESCHKLKFCYNEEGKITQLDVKLKELDGEKNIKLTDNITVQGGTEAKSYSFKVDDEGNLVNLETKSTGSKNNPANAEATAEKTLPSPPPSRYARN